MHVHDFMIHPHRRLAVDSSHNKDDGDDSHSARGRHCLENDSIGGTQKKQRTNPPDEEPWEFPDDDRDAAEAGPPAVVERPVVTVLIVGTDSHLWHDLGEGVAVQLREIDGQFPDDHDVPVCRCIPTTISLTEDAVGQPVLSVSASRNEASFTTYGSRSSIEPWLSSEWGPMPDAVSRIFDAVERAETLLRSIQSRYPTADLPHVAKPDVNDLAARRGDGRALQVMYDRAMDQFYLLVAASKLLDRSVLHYHDRQVKHYWDEQDNARERAGVDAPGYEQGIPRPIFEFDALSTRATNSVQDEAKRDFLDNTAVGAYGRLRAGGCVASHICYRAEDVNFDNERLSADNSASQVYYEFVRGKYGSAGKGSRRLRHIRRDHEEWGLAPPRAYSVCDLANITEGGQRETVRFLLSEFERFQCQQMPVTLRDVLVQDMQGLSVGTSIIMHSLREPYDERRIGTGGIALPGRIADCDGQEHR